MNIDDAGTYSGTVKPQTQIRYGYGIYVANEGITYSGFWKDDVAHDFGLLVFDNSDVYIGEWQQGAAHGQGSYLYIEKSHEDLKTNSHNIKIGVY